MGSSHIVRPSLALTFIVLAIGSRFTTGQQEREPTRRALLISCSEFPQIRDWLRKKGREAAYYRSYRLEGPENDAAMMRDTLINSLGFDPSSITTLTTRIDAEQQATLSNIVSALEDAARTTVSGDLFVFHYAGHGTQIRDSDGDEDDGYDEALLPMDARLGAGGGIENVVTDDMLAAALKRITRRGARVRVILDCCHAGTGARAETFGRERQLDLEGLGLTSPLESSARRSRTEHEFEGADGLAALYAVQSHQRAMELLMPFDGADHRAVHGVFTYSLCKVLRSFAKDRRDPSFDELERAIVGLYLHRPWSHLDPVFEGGDLTGTFCHGPVMARELVLSRSSDALVLNAGQFSGIEVGTEVEIVTDDGDDAAIKGFARVIRAGALQSWCEAVDQASPWSSSIPTTGIEVRVATRPLSRQLTLWCDGGAPEGLPAVIERLSGRWRLCESPVEALWHLQRHDSAWTLDAVGSRYSGVVVTAESLNSVLRSIGRFEVCRRIAERWSSPLPRGLSVEVTTMTPVGGQCRLQSGESVAPGDRVSVSITNQTLKAIDINVLYFGPDYQIVPVWPRASTSALLAAGESVFPVQGNLVNDAPLGIERLLIVAAAEGRLGRRLLELSQDALSPRTRRAEATEGQGLLDLIHEGASRSGNEGYRPRVNMTMLAMRSAWPDIVLPRPDGRHFQVRKGTQPSGARWPKGTETSAGSSSATWIDSGDEPHTILVCGETDSAGNWDSTAPRTAFIDLRTENPPARRHRTARSVTGFDFDVAIRLFPDGSRTTAWDTDDDGDVDVVLVDSDGDAIAESRWTRDVGAWTCTPTQEDWICTGLVTKRPQQRRRAIRRLRALLP